MTAVWTGAGPAAVTVADLRSRATVGAPVGDTRGLPGRVRRAVALAEATGAPLLPVVEAAVEALEDDRRRDRALRVATAQTRAVAGGLLAMPVVLVPTAGRLLGLDVVGFYTSPAGQVVLAAAVALIAVGALLVRGSLRRATRRSPGGRASSGPTLLVGLVGTVLVGPVVGVVLAAVAHRLRSRSSAPSIPPGELDETVDLVATAMSAGLPSTAACREAAAHAPRPSAVALRHLALSLSLDRPPLDVAVAPLAAVLATAGGWGAPAAPALRSLARDLRAEALADALAAAERLPAQLTVPTALCLLPASVLLVGAPLVAEGLAAAAGVR